MKQDTSDNWQDEFDNEFADKMHGDFQLVLDLKNFIRSKRKEWIEEGRKEGTVRNEFIMAGACKLSAGLAKQETIKQIREWLSGSWDLERKETLKDFLKTLE